jgi:multisubunit Na+/H+ antiporter MnhB subunit
MTTGRMDRSPPHLILQVLLGIFALALAVALGWAVWSLPPETIGLRDQVQAKLAESGASNPVTAVIINFRGYDTLLEMGVLLLAVLGVWASGPSTPLSLQSEAVHKPVLTALVRQLTPLLVLVAIYLLWAGGHAPGGAFQGGAVLGAAGVLLLMSDISFINLRPGWPLRIVLLLGLALFLLVATGVMLAGGHLLEYPPAWAAALILLIEGASTLSIGCMLVLLFTGGPLTASPSAHLPGSREQAP